MKRLVLVLVLLSVITSAWGVQPQRKPFIQIKIDDKNFRNGDILTVTPGQKLSLSVDMEGGRRDFCKFPDTYADIAGKAQILSRGENGLTYEMNGTKGEWKLLSEKVSYNPDQFVEVKPQSNQLLSEIVMSSGSFSQTFLKITVRATWQLDYGGVVTQEENLAETTIYFKVAGTTDEWFSTTNVKASGMKNDQILEKLGLVQANCDSIENNFFKLKFAAVQASVRNLQASVSALKSSIDEVKAGNPSYKISVSFVGLPSDNPVKDVVSMNTLKTNWNSLQPLITDLHQKLNALPEQPDQESKDQLIDLIGSYADWQYKLPENTFKLIQLYMPDIPVDSIRIPGNIHFIAEQKTVSNYSQTTKEFNAFLNQRMRQIPNETQVISSTQSRLQAIRLFDGMLRSYFSSVSWAEWVNTRE